MTDYTEDKGILGLSDVSGVLTSASRVPCQDMDDTDKLGYVTPASILAAGVDGSIFRVPLFLNIAKIAVNSKPTVDFCGIVSGYSLPVFNDDDEELYLSVFVPLYWAGDSDLSIKLRCHLKAANLNKKFKFEICWNHLPIGSAICEACHVVVVEVDTGDAVELKSFEVEFPIPFDIDGAGHEVKTTERFVARLRRVAASSDEVTGEVVVAPPEISGVRSSI